MVKNLYDYLAKPDKTIGEHVEDLLYRANILRKLNNLGLIEPSVRHG